MRIKSIGQKDNLIFYCALAFKSLNNHCIGNKEWSCSSNGSINGWTQLIHSQILTDSLELIIFFSETVP